MTFYEAIKALEEGKKVRRKAWGCDTYICTNVAGGFMNYDVGKDFVGGEKFIGYYLLSLKDIKATDWELYNEPILDKEEKEYLEAVLRPFKDNVEGIYKGNYSTNNYRINNDECIYIRLGVLGGIEFPRFKKDTMYKGMKLNKKYTLEELGLFK